ncbi:MAG TPA: carboxypeptidase M32 [Acetobacteraceae bacterium]|nr:carboxypeptidase M32 [Acetobacteraceae bacterium]
MLDPAAYDRLKARFARIATLSEAGAMLGWDAAALMPPGGAAARGDQLAVLAGVQHALVTAPEVAADLDRAGAPQDPWEAANLRLMRREHARATALPADLVEAEARANSACEKIWRIALATSDFAMVLPSLKIVLGLVRERAAALSERLGLSPYDALMDGYQPGMLTADVQPLFDRYETFMADALPRAEQRQKKSPPPIRLAGEFPADMQETLCRRLAERAGLDFNHARLDRSIHPFCSGTPSDVRITMRYDETDPVQAMMAVLHETGHALYERGLPEAFSRQPVGAPSGMAAHESQSLIMEMQACRSDPFLGWLSNELVAAFKGAGPAWAPSNLARLWRRVERGFIRVDADEMTYPAHVILRFKLERAMVAGELAVEDLPGAWAEELHRLLGITPPDDRRGCLQDIHWYEGIFGYFPAYTLGAMAAAQMMSAARAAVPDLDRALAKGDLVPLTNWLREHVHAYGSRLDFNELLCEATGRKLDPAAFEAHLTARYLS